MQLFFVAMLTALVCIVSCSALAQCPAEDNLNALAAKAPPGTTLVIQKEEDGTYTSRLVVPTAPDPDRAPTTSPTITEAIVALKPIKDAAVAVEVVVP